MLLRFLVGASAVVLALRASVATAQPREPDPISGGVYLGGYYGAARGDTVDLDSGQYPTFGGLFESEYVRFQGETPIPFLLIDLAATLVLLIGGSDEGLPIYDALNGDLEPGHFRMFDLALTAHVFRSGRHTLDVGLSGEFSTMRAYLDGEAFGRNSFDLAPSVGYSIDTPRALLAATFRAGNGFGSDTNDNPFIGFGVLGVVRVDGWFGLLFRQDLTIQRMNYEADDIETRKDGSLGLVEWAGFGAMTVGMAWLAE